MNKSQLFSDIFIDSQRSNQADEEPSFLDISELLFTNVESRGNPFNFEESSPEHELFFHLDEDDQGEHLPELEKKESKDRQFRCKSMYNKNVCFNICQKTIKVIKKGFYDAKLLQICSEFGVEAESFRKNIQRIKKDFTGPKALAQYLQKKEAESCVFKEFMKWFLAEKYLRHALIEGEMKDVKAYIEYKNEVILPLLH